MNEILDSRSKRRIAIASSGIGYKHYLLAREVYQDLIEACVKLSESSIAYFHLYDEKTEQIALGVWNSAVLQYCYTHHVSHYPLKEAGIWADAVRLRQTVVHNDYPNTPSAKGLPDGHFTLTRHMSTPVFEDEKIVGIVGVGNSKTEYSPEIIKDFEKFVAEVWPTVAEEVQRIKNRASRLSIAFEAKNPREILRSMIGAISKALESRDEYTAMHQSNVSYIATLIARELELPEEQIYGLGLGALVHDIGKIATPTEILTKPGKLTKAQFELLKSHAEAGAAVFSEIDLPWNICQMILQHHERMDGSGYPHQLVAEDICLEARIIAVADTFDAMASDRPYRKCPGYAAALTQIKDQRGKAFDTYAVDAFLSVERAGLLSPRYVAEGTS